MTEQNVPEENRKQKCTMASMNNKNVQSKIFDKIKQELVFTTVE